jgi:2-C-methyl-D-erythritol 2,4-cyclodiphosphate synthase
MQEAMAPIMGVALEDISIKATTNETMGYVGRGEGICAHAVALIQKK